ncbi:MAG: DUF4147 domain-containing protein [Oscillospiraceae bacterium]
MHWDGPLLRIGEKTWDLSKKRHVYMIGAGKACNAMTMAVDEILGDYLTHGYAIVKIAEPTGRVPSYRRLCRRTSHSKRRRAARVPDHSRRGRSRRPG